MELREYWTPTRPLLHRHPLHRTYPLLPGDLLVYFEDSQEWGKVAPGLQVMGFAVDVLEDELQAVRVYWTDPLTYIFADTVPAPQVMAEHGLLPPVPTEMPTDIEGRELEGEWDWDGTRWVFILKVE